MKIGNTKSKWFLVPLLLAGLFQHANAQQPVIRWNNCHKPNVTNDWPSQDQIAGLEVTSDSGYIVTGYSGTTNRQIALEGHHNANGNVIGSDAYVVKVGADNQEEWSKFYGGITKGNADSDNYDILTAVKQLPTGGYLLAGSTNSIDGDVVGYHGGTGRDGWVVKIDDLGAIVWQKCFGGTAMDDLSKILLLDDGTFLLGGYSASSDGDLTGITKKGGNDSWIIHINATGDLLDSHVYGGTGSEAIAAFVKTSDGGYAFATNTSSTNGDVSGNHGGFDYWLVKLDNTLALQWQNCFGGSANELARELQVTTDGGYIINGSSLSVDAIQVSAPKGGNNYDFWVVKTDGSGTLVWEKSLGGTNVDDGYGIIGTQDGGYLATGHTASTNMDVSGLHGTGVTYDTWIVKLTALGAIEWSRCVGSSGFEQYGKIYQSKDGEFIIVPRSSRTRDGDNSCYNSDYDSGEDYWIFKLSACPSYSSLRESICAGTEFDFHGTLLTEAGEYTHTLQTAGGCDSTITITLTVNPLPFPSITAVGTTLSTGDFVSYEWLQENNSTGINTQSYSMTENGNYKVVVTNEDGCRDTSAVYVHSVTGIWNSTKTYGINLHPNPVSDAFTISSERSESLEVVLSSTEGKELLRQTVVSNGTVDVSVFPQGVYLVKLFEKGELKSIQKIIKK